MVKCANCAAAAVRSSWGGVTAGCRGCRVRELARAPRFIRESELAAELAETNDMAAINELQAEIAEEVERAAALAAAEGRK